MPQSPCCFRSVHCAALIALAAVAGLSRLATTEATPEIDNSISSRSTAVSYESKLARFFEVFHPRFSEYFGPAKASAETGPPGENLRPSSLFESAGFPLVVATSSQTGQPETPEGVAVRSWRRHEIPYAVGPPVRGRSSIPLIAVGLSGEGDIAGVESAVRLVSSPAPRISSVRVDAGPKEVTLVHPGLPSPVVAEAPNPPDLAGLGEPSRSPPLSTRSEPARPLLS